MNIINVYFEKPERGEIMKKLIAILCVLLLLALTACAPQAPEAPPAEDMAEPEAEAAPEALPAADMPELEAEAAPEDGEPEAPEKTDIEMFVETSEYMQGTPGDQRAGSYHAPEFLKEIAFRNKLGNRLIWWGVNFEVTQIEEYAITIVTFPDGEAKTWDLDVYDDLFFGTSPQCEDEANCGDIPFAYTWDEATATKLYCPLSIPICEEAKEKYVEPYN
ncbi:MAG: hypothetical protein KAT43_04395 [Nanoarchaeota archaeon]|nr:hypothetical protein [Nanoarchaeota archaeon]